MISISKVRLESTSSISYAYENLAMALFVPASRLQLINLDLVSFHPFPIPHYIFRHPPASRCRTQWWCYKSRTHPSRFGISIAGQQLARMEIVGVENWNSLMSSGASVHQACKCFRNLPTQQKKNNSFGSNIEDDAESISDVTRNAHPFEDSAWGFFFCFSGTLDPIWTDDVDDYLLRPSPFTSLLLTELSCVTRWNRDYSQFRLIRAIESGATAVISCFVTDHSTEQSYMI